MYHMGVANVKWALQQFEVVLEANFQEVQRICNKLVQPVYEKISNGERIELQATIHKSKGSMLEKIELAERIDRPE